MMGEDRIRSIKDELLDHRIGFRFIINIGLNDSCSRSCKRLK